MVECWGNSSKWQPVRVWHNGCISWDMWAGLKKLLHIAAHVCWWCRRGKTSLLWQELSDRLASPGMERSGLPWISLEDERLIGSGPACSSMRCR